MRKNPLGAHVNRKPVHMGLRTNRFRCRGFVTKQNPTSLKLLQLELQE